LATEIQGAIGFSVFQNNDLLLAQHKNQGGAVESTLLATDPQRSVLHTLTADQQQHPIAYSPYGHRQAESGLTSLLGFNGERPDPVTGHYLLGNGYRSFSPVLMRFNSPDSLSPFEKGGVNPYTYSLGNPISLSDPTGHSPIHSIIKMPLKNLDFAPKNFKNIDHWIETVYNKTPKHMRPIFEQQTPLAGRPAKRTRAMSVTQVKSDENFYADDLIGYHGSHPSSTKSLLSGIDSTRGRTEYYGKGFYSTPTYERTVHYGEKRFGVYVSNQKSLKEGRDYSFHRSPDAFQHGDYVELIIRPPAYHLVRI
jgi:RHS repeat-associated protein